MQESLRKTNVSLDEMMAEVEAQLDLARSMGLKIPYMDTHMGVGWVGGLEPRLRDLATSEGIIFSHDAVHGLPRPEGEFPNLVERTVAALKAAEPGTYLIVGHPCYDRVDVRMFGHKGLEPSKEGINRDWQRRIFMDREILDCCAEIGVEPIRYSDI